jgi:hypothetical protein
MKVDRARADPLSNRPHTQVLTSEVDSDCSKQEKEEKASEDAATAAVVGPQLPSKANVAVRREDGTRSFRAG